MSEPASGEVFDLGYRGYEGERTGRFGRRRAIWRDGIRISLGLGRGLGAKFTSWLLLGLALVPIVVLVVVSAFLSPLEEARNDFDLPSYADYFDWAHIPLGLFAAVVAPLLLCPDRREGVLSLYAARPITPADYVGSRWAAFLTVMALAGWLPLTVLFTWNALDASSPGRFVVDNWDLLPRILAGRFPAAATGHGSGQGNTDTHLLGISTRFHVCWIAARGGHPAQPRPIRNA